MADLFLTIDRVPDLTLAKYSGESDSDCKGLLEKHRLFLRQIHRLLLVSGGARMDLMYQYNPEWPAGKRMKVFLSFSGSIEQEMIERIMSSCALAPYYTFRTCEKPDLPAYAICSTIAKQDGFVASSIAENCSYYVVDEWKTNDEARLSTLFQLMKSLDKPCVYVVSLAALQAYPEAKKRIDATAAWIRSLASGKGIGTRDENADQVLRRYNKYLDDLRANPQFTCRISAYADTPAVAGLLVDAAASEALSEGSYTSRQHSCGGENPIQFQQSLFGACLCHPDLLKTASPSQKLSFWNMIYSVDEISPFFAFPVLYLNERVEIPKESAPVYDNAGLHLGKDTSEYDVYLPWKHLPRHALVAGVPGGGKTYTMLHIATELKRHNIPFLVLEPAKQEYRALAKHETMNDLLVFSPAAPNSFPLRINPFEFPVGMKLSEHIVNLRMVFEGTFDLTEGPMPMLIDEGIEQVYRMHGWRPFYVNNGKRPYPQMSELYTAVEQMLKKLSYAPEVRDNLMTMLQVRIGSLMKRDMGNVFNVPFSSIIPEKWLSKSCVIELETLGKDGANFLTLLLATLIREYLKLHPTLGADAAGRPDGAPRHVIFFEEAHNLIGPKTESDGEGGNAKVASTQFIVNMLAEVRALKEAIIIADQLPTALAPQVTKNTSLKIAHKIVAQDDRQFIGSTMSIDAVQLEQLSQFTSGRALCIYEGLQKPFEIQITKYDGDSEPPSNDELFEMMKDRTAYLDNLAIDAGIMKMKYSFKLKKIQEESRIARDRCVELMKNDALPGKVKAACKALHDCKMDLCECLLEVLDYANTNRTHGNRLLPVYRRNRDSIDKLFGQVLDLSDYPEDKEIMETIARNEQQVGFQ